jgi:CheY-like chemotaxis protein
MDTPPAAPLTIIVVEDNPVDVYLMRWVLTAHELPYTLHVIDNADHAMNYLDELAQQDRHRSPTIMLLDLEKGGNLAVSDKHLFLGLSGKPGACATASPRALGPNTRDLCRS